MFIDEGGGALPYSRSYGTETVPELYAIAGGIGVEDSLAVTAGYTLEVFTIKLP